MGLRYKLKRILESPPSFLMHKALIDARKVYLAPVFWLSRKRGFLTKKGEAQLLSVCAEKSNSLRSNIKKTLSQSGQYLSFLNQQNIISKRDIIKILGYGSANLNENDFWHGDGFHDFVWQPAYFSKIDFIAANHKCDVKVPWEKSRLQFLVVLAFIALEKDEQEGKELAARCLEILFDWHKKNPLCYSVNWISAMEVAIRSINICLVTLLLFRWLTESEKEKVAQILLQHRYYLKKFPEISDIPGNHYLASELGLFVLNLFISENEQTREACYYRFIKVVKFQFADNGLHIENAPIYHRLCLEMLVIAQAFSRLFNISTDALDETLKKGIAACFTLDIGEYTLPHFADSDSGKVVDFDHDSKSYAHIYNYVYKKNVGSMSAQFFADFFHCFDLDRQDQQQELIDICVPQCVAPYATLTNKHAKMIIKAGDLGLHGRAAHDHDDNLSFWLRVFGHDFVVDPGCAPYTLDPKERRHNISSCQHNVISLNDMPRYFSSRGSIAATVRGAPKGVVEVLNPDYFKANVLTTTKKTDDNPVLFTREFSLLEDDHSIKVTIKDIIERKASVTDNFSMPLFLAPGISIEAVESTGVSLSVGKITARLNFLSTVDFNIKTQSYNYYPEYGACSQANAIVISGKLGKKQECVETEIIIRQLPKGNDDQ